MSRLSYCIGEESARIVESEEFLEYLEKLPEGHMTIEDIGGFIVEAERHPLQRAFYSKSFADLWDTQAITARTKLRAMAREFTRATATYADPNNDSLKNALM